MYMNTYTNKHTNVFKGIELNPWEESRAYQSYKNEQDDLPPNAQPQYPRDRKLIGLSFVYCIYVYIYVYVCMFVYMYLYIYMYV
jgi:hypothetical protein